MSIGKRVTAQAPFRSRLRSPRRLGSVGAAPERSGIDALGIEGEHPIIKLSGGRRLLVETNKVLDVAARFLDVLRRVIGIERTVPDHDGSRIQRLDLVDGSDPVDKPLPVGLDEV
jgi:hypothetical protein